MMSKLPKVSVLVPKRDGPTWPSDVHREQTLIYIVPAVMNVGHMI